ncbi:MAG: SurA N-terminal domain-containing protein [Terriglobales bacterium]
MKRSIIFSCALLLAQAAVAQSTIDRVVAVVNKKVITHSDWDEQERFEALVNGRAPESVEFSLASLDRLVDQQLMREQIDHVRFDPLSPEQIAAQVATVRRQVAPGMDDAQWRALLAKYSLSEAEFSARVAAQVEVMRFVDLRFRPSVHVEGDQVESYYKQSLVPELMKAGAREDSMPPMKEVEPKIRGILAEQRLNEILRMWLTSLRAQGRVKRMLPENPAAKSQSPTPTGAD